LACDILSILRCSHYHTADGEGLGRPFIKRHCERIGAWPYAHGFHHTLVLSGMQTR